MDSTDLIRTLMGRAANIAIFLSPSAPDYEFLLKEALKSALERTGKNVISLPENNLSQKAKWGELAKPSSRGYPEKIFIRLPRRVSLEEIPEEDGSTFALSAPDAIRPEEISVMRGLAVPDAVISFSEQSQSLGALHGTLRLPPSDRILFLGTKTRTLTEKTADIIKIAAGEMREEASLLFASLLEETRFFRKALSANIFALAKNLIDEGADITNVRRLTGKGISQGITQIFGRALARSFHDGVGHVFWSFLALKDFERAHMPPDRHTIAALKPYFESFSPGEPSSISLVMWEDREGKVWGLAWSEDSARFSHFKNMFGNGSSGELFFFGPYENFSTAELQLKSFLKELPPLP